MKRIKNLSLVTLILLLSAGCVQTKKPKATTVIPPHNNPHEIPIAVTEPIPPSQRPPIVYPSRPQVLPPQVITPQRPPIYVEPPYIPPRSPYLGGAYANNYQLRSFIANMARKYNYDPYQLNTIFSTVSRDTLALDKYNVYKPSKPHSKTTSVGSWNKYRSNFLTPERIRKGVAFWQENAYYLNKAAYEYGVPPEYIVGIIGVETNFGGFTGKHSILNALTTLALEYKQRSKFFTSELENYLLILRDEKLHPQKIKGSYAGAFGLAQFMPSSFREYAVDFDGDGHINLFNKADAIGSIANYFRGKGKWQPGIPVAMMVYYNKPRFYGLPTGFKTSYSQRHLQQLGMRPSSDFGGYRGNVSLIKLSKYDRDELWWGTPNFRAITRYNPKDYYAMAVHQLGQAIKRARYGR